MPNSWDDQLRTGRKCVSFNCSIDYHWTNTSLQPVRSEAKPDDVADTSG